MIQFKLINLPESYLAVLGFVDNDNNGTLFGVDLTDSYDYLFSIRFLAIFDLIEVFDRLSLINKPPLLLFNDETMIAKEIYTHLRRLSKDSSIDNHSS